MNPLGFIKMKTTKTGLFVSDTIPSQSLQKIQGNKNAFTSNWADNASDWRYTLNGSMIAVQAPHCQRVGAVSHLKSLVCPTNHGKSQLFLQAKYSDVVCTRLSGMKGCRTFVHLNGFCDQKWERNTSQVAIFGDIAY